MDSSSCDVYQLSYLLHSRSCSRIRSLRSVSVESQRVEYSWLLNWGGVSPSYRLCMYYLPSIYFLSLISVLCHHLNLPLTITEGHSESFLGQETRHLLWKGAAVNGFRLLTPPAKSVGTDGFSLESDWKQISSGLDSSKYGSIGWDSRIRQLQSSKGVIPTTRHYTIW